MTSTVIVVKWLGCREVMTIDLGELKKGVQIEQTTETWSEDQNSYPYVTTSAFEPDKSGGGKLTIFYSAASNPALTGLDCRWGHSILHLDKDIRTGRAEWHDGAEIGLAASVCEYSGNRMWERFSKGPSILSKKETETVERVARRQARFRKRLFMIDPKCAITGEQERSLLDAAHVVPAAEDGSDIEENGLLLRVDLHRLFDNKFFSISRKGKIVVAKKLKSGGYRDLLEKCGGIDKSTYARIKGAWAIAKKGSA